MPLSKGSSRATISGNIREFHKGQTYAHTSAKFGKRRANAQAVAVAMREAGKSRKKKRRLPTIAEGGGLY